MFNNFKKSFSKYLPDFYIYYFYNLFEDEDCKNKIYQGNKCLVCEKDGLTYHEYLEGVGYICTTCLF